MADSVTTIYVSSGGPPPSKEEIKGIYLLIGLGAVWLVLYSIYDALIHWQQFSAPYKYVLAFYYYLIIVPLYSFGRVWYWLRSLEPTPFVNINFIVSLIGILIYTAIFLGVLSVTLHWLKKIGIGIKSVGFILLLPLILSVLWFIVSGIFSWIFTTY